MLNIKDSSLVLLLPILLFPSLLLLLCLYIHTHTRGFPSFLFFFSFSLSALSLSLFCSLPERSVRTGNVNNKKEKIRTPRASSKCKRETSAKYCRHHRRCLLPFFQAKVRQNDSYFVVLLFFIKPRSFLYSVFLICMYRTKIITTSKITLTMKRNHRSIKRSCHTCH